MAARSTECTKGPPDRTRATLLLSLSPPPPLLTRPWQNERQLLNPCIRKKTRSKLPIKKKNTSARLKNSRGGKKLMFVLLSVAGQRGGRGQVRRRWQALPVPLLQRQFPPPEQVDPPHPVPQPGLAQVPRVLLLLVPLSAAERSGGSTRASARRLRFAAAAAARIPAGCETRAAVRLPLGRREFELQSGLRVGADAVGGGRGARGRRRRLQVLRAGVSGRECSGGAPARPHRRQTFQVFLLW